MEMLSPHCSYDEAIRSQTATREGINNTPPPEILAVMRVTAENVLERARAMVTAKRGKDTPIVISSFYRCPKLNGDIPGASITSQHPKGEAIDMEVNEAQDGAIPAYTKRDLFNDIRTNLEFDQLIWEYGDNEQPAWVHMSFSPGKNRKMVMRATRGTDGRPKYELVK